MTDVMNITKMLRQCNNAVATSKLNTMYHEIQIHNLCQNPTQVTF